MSGVELIDEGPEDGAAILLLHGAGTDADLWRPQRVTFAQRFRVITVNLPGHGRSPMVAGGVPGMAAAVQATLAAHGIGRYAAVGLSLGGMVALELAALWPGEVSHLVMAESVAHVSDNPIYRLTAHLGIGLLWATGPKVLGLLPDATIGAETAGAAAYLREAAERITRDDLQAVMRAGLDYDGRPHLARLRQPALVVIGDRNRDIRSRATAMAEEMADARLVRLSGAGHLVNLDAAGAFNAAVLGFLDEAG